METLLGVLNTTISEIRAIEHELVILLMDSINIIV
jgi:hypothetical protein